MPETTTYTPTGNALLEMLAACRMLRRHLGGASCTVWRREGEVLCAAPHNGVSLLHLYRAEDVLAWYRAVARGRTPRSETLREAMEEHSHLLKPF